MTARTRKWVMLSALCLLSLDLALVAVAAPRAWGWLQGARTSALARAGTIALRDLQGRGEWRVENLSGRASYRRADIRAFIVRANPCAAARAAARAAAMREEASWVIVATPSVPSVPEVEAIEAVEVTPDCPSVCRTPSCPLSSCPTTTCPKSAASKGAVSGSSATGLPISMLGMTLE